MNNRRAARAAAPHFLLVAYLVMNVFGLISTFSIDLADDEARVFFRATYTYVVANGNGVLLLIGSLLFLQDKVLGPLARGLVAVSTLVGLGQVMIVVAGFFVFDRAGRTVGELGSRLAFVLACVLVSVVAWQPTGSIDKADREDERTGDQGGDDTISV